jgi:hypothetical protein
LYSFWISFLFIRLTEAQEGMIMDWFTDQMASNVPKPNLLNKRIEKRVTLATIESIQQTAHQVLLAVVDRPAAMTLNNEERDKCEADDLIRDPLDMDEAGENILILTTLLSHLTFNCRALVVRKAKTKADPIT